MNQISAMTKKKEGIVSFKVTEDLWARIKDMPNRSEFIRGAIQSALDNACPLCQGRGALTGKERQHWHEFLRSHTVERCPDCDGIIIKCRER
ncbi:MAG TPA: hypothetical protein PLT64_05465 [Syntrophales bacterium]|nr:hypothetical protein [Syntrophales bacterium]HOL59300.1 hypothetical protein [Syntrophales bacterium]HPO35507.1 hypothetical protein [Syntrophales bacterium]